MPQSLILLILTEQTRLNVTFSSEMKMISLLLDVCWPEKQQIPEE